MGLVTKYDNEEARINSEVREVVVEQSRTMTL
jgi:hypothetical protein